MLAKIEALSLCSLLIRFPIWTVCVCVVRDGSPFIPNEENFARVRVHTRAQMEGVVCVCVWISLMVACGHPPHTVCAVCCTFCIGKAARNFSSPHSLMGKKKGLVPFLTSSPSPLSFTPRAHTLPTSHTTHLQSTHPRTPSLTHSPSPHLDEPVGQPGSGRLFRVTYK